MSYNNVNLWFAKDENNNIITINEIDSNNKGKYHCPLCGSDVIPKAIKEDAQITSHFAHIDKSKCNGESMVHFWFKNKFLVPGDKFTIKTDVQKEYICKEVLIEQIYQTEIGDYKPDVTVITKCGETIYFEMEYSNKKKLEDYIDKWLELDNIVVEVDLKILMNSGKKGVCQFNTLFYKGKCFNVKKSNLYYNTIGKYKEKIYKNNDNNNELKERIKKLDWFWIDINRYIKKEVDIDYMIDLIDIVEDKDKEVIEEILNKPKCVDLLEKYLDKKVNDIYENIYLNAENKLHDNFLQYIDKFVGTIGYSSNKRWLGEIKIKDITDGCFCVYNVLRHSKNYIVEQCESYIDNIVIYNKVKDNIQIYNTNANLIKQSILDNIVYQNYMIRLMNNNPKYHMEVDVKNKFLNKTNLKNFDMNLFDITFNLNFNYQRNCADNFKITTLFDTNFDNICNLMIEKFNTYFNNLSYLNNIDELELLSVELKNRYFDYNVNVYGNMIYEDIYEIRVSVNNSNYSRESYYISNKGVVSNYGVATSSRGNKILLETSNINEIKIYLIREINNQIIKSTASNCIECNNKFTLELGEVRFFHLKGFEYPSRCEPCRDIRKKLKLQGGIIHG